MRILFSFSIVIFLLGSCTTSSFKKGISIKNSLDIDRKEVISLPISLMDTLPEGFIWIVKSGDNDVVSQRIDYDGDSKDDVLIFQVDLKANEEKAFTLISTDKKIDINTPVKTFSRFVPERIDDYAWENDLVAFRTYGPEAQRLVDEG